LPQQKLKTAYITKNSEQSTLQDEYMKGHFMPQNTGQLSLPSLCDR